MSNLKVVKAGTHGFFDIFQGIGWKNHVRVRMIKGDNIVVISPEKYVLSNETKKEIVSLIKQGLTKFVNPPKKDKI